MALHDIIGDRIAEQCTSAPGLSDYQFDATPPGGYRTIAATLASGVNSPSFVFPYIIVTNGNAAGGGAPAPGSVWEIVSGQYTKGTPNTQARTNIWGSSNGGSKVNWTSQHLPLLAFPFPSADILNSVLQQGGFWVSPPAWFQRGPWFGAGGGASSRTWNIRVAPGNDKTLLTFNETTGAITLPAGNFVDLTSGQTIGGDKIFTGATVLKNGSTVLHLDDNGAGAGPSLFGYRNSLSPAALDLLMELYWRGKNSAAADVNYARLLGYIISPTAGAEYGGADLYVMQNGVLTLVQGWRDGVIIGNPTGAYKGVGALNAQALYRQGVEVMPGASALFQEQQASGTNGGTFTTGARRTRTINTEVHDPDGIASLSTNDIVLGAGLWMINWWATAYQVQLHQTFLRNVTDAVDIAPGASGRCIAGATSISQGNAIVRLAATKNIRLEHQCSQTENTDGFGIASSFGTEVYAQVHVTKLGV